MGRTVRLGRRAFFPVTVGGGGSGDITPHLVVEYVDTSGTLQTVTVASDGSTTITGYAPLLVHFDASGTRSAETTGNTESGAFFNIGYRLRYGDSLSGTWPHSSQPRSEDVGAPIFGRIYESAGEYLARLKVRDSAGTESSISLQINAVDPPNVVTINAGGGGWPTFNRATRYRLNAGSDYSSYGFVNANGLDNISFEKTGSGDDPVIAGVLLNSTGGTRASSTVSQIRAAHIRFADISIGEYAPTEVGAIHCGALRGSIGTLNFTSIDYYTDYTSEGRVPNETYANNCRLQRGVFFQGVHIQNDGTWNDYVFIDSAKHAHFIGCDLRKYRGSSGSHAMRPYLIESTIRHCNLWVEIDCFGVLKGSAYTWSYGRTSADEHRSDDTVLNWNGGSPYRWSYVASKNAVENNLFGKTGINDYARDLTSYGANPENNEPYGPSSPYEAAALWTFENNRSTALTYGAGGTLDIWLNGQNLGSRGNTFTPSGSNHGAATGNSPNRIPPGMNGPYIAESTNSRPVPTTF